MVSPKTLRQWQGRRRHYLLLFTYVPRSNCTAFNQRVAHLGTNESIIMTSGRLRRRRMQRWSSENESYSSATSTSPSKTHRRSSSLISGSSSIRLESSDGNIRMKLSHTTKADNPLLRCLRASWSSAISASSRSSAYKADCSHESKMTRCNTLCGKEDRTFCAFELIRQLSFSPPRKTKKRANTDETDASSSFDLSESDSRHSIDLDLDLDIDLKQANPSSRSPSPLLGLKYLKD